MTAEPSETPKRRKKKRGLDQKAKGAQASAQTKAESAARADWPSFARHFPEHPEIERLVKAFEDGNYALVRKGAQQLIEAMAAPEKKRKAAASSDEGAASLPKVPEPDAEQRRQIKKAAEELLTRLEPPKLSVFMLLGSVLLLVFLSIWYWTHPQPLP